MEVVVERTHEYFTTMGDDIHCCKIKLGEFIIRKQLGKPPKDYLMPKVLSP